MSNANKGVFTTDEVFQRLQEASWPIPSAGGGGEVTSGITPYFITRVYTGDNTTSTFNVTSGMTASNILVFENGVSQVPQNDYTVSNGILSFVTPPETGVVIHIRELGGSATTPSGGAGSGVFTAGTGITITDQGVISAIAASTDKFDIYIDGSEYKAVTNSMEPILSLPVSNDTRYRIHSLMLTNISDSVTFLNANLVYNNNTFVYANAYEIPYGFTIDLIINPELMMPNTIVKLQALDNTLTPANGKLSAYITYKTLADVSYDAQTTTIGPSNTFVTIYDANVADMVVESMKFINHRSVNEMTTIYIQDSNSNIKAYLSANNLLAKNFYSEMLENPIKISIGDKIKAANFSGKNDAVTTIVSARKLEAYISSANLYTLFEGSQVFFNLTPLNVPVGQRRWWRITGTSGASDFTGNTSGYFDVTSVGFSANIVLTVAEDLSTNNEGDETVAIQILKGGPNGTVVHTSEYVTIKDTSNSSISLSSTTIYEGESVIFTVNTASVPTLYYSITGNADIFGANTGTINIVNGTGNVEIIAETNVPDGETRQFAVQLRKDSTSGTIVTTSNVVYVQTAQEIVMTATGGNVLILEI
jgi:hypothetical protein